MYLLSRNIIHFDEYDEIRNRYISKNSNIKLYSLSPRVFGELWSERHLMSLDSRFSQPSKKKTNGYKGEYDLLIDGVRVEVKSCRAVEPGQRRYYQLRAMQYDPAKRFWLNFQQIKIESSDVFIFIGVWADKIKYWTLSGEEVRNNKYLTHQHRGGIEYQIGIRDTNMSYFRQFEITREKLADLVIAKGKKWCVNCKNPSMLLDK